MFLKRYQDHFIIDLSRSQEIFNNLTSDPEKLLTWHTLFMFFTCYICSKGVKGGLEKAVKTLYQYYL